MSDILTDLDLFNTPDGARAKDPRFALPEPEQDDGPAQLNSYERMEHIFRDVVSQAAPTPAELATYRQRGYRTRIEFGAIPVNGFIGKVSEPQFAWMVACLTSSDNPTSFLNGLKQTQSNGRWMVSRVQCRKGREMRKDGLRPARLNLPGGPDQFEMFPPNQALFDAYEIGIETMDYAIEWIDTAGQEDLRWDINGKPLVDPVVKVETNATMDPRLVDAMMAQGKALEALATAVARPAAEPTEDAPADKPKRAPKPTSPLLPTPLPADVEARIRNAEKSAGRPLTDDERAIFLGTKPGQE